MACTSYIQRSSQLLTNNEIIRLRLKINAHDRKKLHSFKNRCKTVGGVRHAWLPFIVTGNDVPLPSHHSKHMHCTVFPRFSPKRQGTILLMKTIG